MDNGNIFVISAPSGTGKSSLVQKLCTLDLNLKSSISHTTRSIRNVEQDGVHYFFIDAMKFKQMIAQNQFIEYAEVFGNLYGTSITMIKNIISKKNIILEIDYQGAYQIKKIFPASILIFILPPKLSILEQRLNKRNTDDPVIIRQRLAKAQNEITQAINFDYLIINDDFNLALRNLYSIIQSTILKNQDKSLLIHDTLN